MEDILASIRRILSDDEPAASPPAAADDAAHAPAVPAASVSAAAGPVPAAPVAPPPSRSVAPLPPPAESLPPGDEDVLSLDASMLVKEPLPVAPPPPRADVAPAAATPFGLVAPAAAAAAASSVGSLVRTLIAGREQVSVHRGGPTIEDVVREELRPILKLWLDTNLPPLVERLVQAEIERVVSRTSA